jgi:hypothetical protein
MNTLIPQGYLPGYWGQFNYGFTQQFNQRITVNFDDLTIAPGVDRRVLVQCEPPELYQAFAGRVEACFEQFDLILTYHDRLLKLPNAVEFCPVGGWVGDIALEKRNQITYLMSSKIYTNAHRLRFMILRRWGDRKNIGDFEFFMHRSPPRVPSKDPFYANAKFNIACENQFINNMFTEKLLDCFTSRTVPIYFGCPNLGKYFDVRGIIQFNTIEQLEHILATLTPNDYEQRLPYIEANYQLSRPYCEQNIYQRIENIVAEKLGI